MTQTGNPVHRVRPQPGGARPWVRIALLVLGLMACLPAATWNGGGTTDLWTDAGNWGGTAPVAGDALVFAGNTRITPVNDFAAGTVFASITFSAGAGNFVLTGNGVTLSAGATALRSLAVAGTMTVDLPVTFSTAAATITSTAGGALVVDDAISNGGLLLTVAAGGPVTLTGAITGAGGLTKSGAATLTVSGLAGLAAGNYSGDTTIDGGTLTVTNATALTGALFMGGTAGSTNISALNLGAANLTTGALTVRTNSATANTITIGAGFTYTTAGNVTIGTAVNATNTVLNVTGAGTWAVNSPNGQFWLGGYNTVVTNNANQASLDMSGLATFTCDLSTTGSMLLGRFGDNFTRAGTMTLATTSTIIAATLTVGESASGSPITLRLGAGANVIRVDTLNLGTGGRDSGIVQFAGGAGTLQLRNRLGTGRANVNIQTGAANTGFSTTNTLNLAGHSVDLQIGNLIVGGQPRGGLATNTITFDTGTLDVTGIRLGLRSGTTVTANAHTSTLNLGGGTVIIGTGGLEVATTSATGATANTLAATVNISGGTVTIANNPTLAAAIRLANNSAVTSGTTANGVLNLTGGSLTVAGNITLGLTTRPATATLTLNGGALALASGQIGSATNLVTANFQSGTLSGLAELNGGGAFTKSTAGTVTLGGTTNAWSGATTISAGTLLLNAANAVPSGTGKGNVTVTGSLDLNGFNTAVNGLSGAGLVTSGVAGACTLTLGNNDASSTFSGVIQNGGGTVAVTKTGTGTVVLSNTNTYSGATTVAAGSLRVSGATAAASAVTITGGTLEGSGTVGGTVALTSGAIAPGNGAGAIGLLTSGSVTCSGSGSLVVDLDGSAPSAERLVTAGTVALDGQLIVATCNNGTSGTVYTIVTAGALTGTFAGLPDGTLFSGGGHTFRINYTATSVTLTDSSSIWDGGGGDNLWSNPVNWVGDAVPPAGAYLVFAGSTNLTPFNDLTGVAFSSLSFAQGAGSFIIGGDPIILTGGSPALVSATTSGTVTIAAPVTFTTAAPTIVTTAGGTLVLSGAVDNGGMAVTVANSGPVSISGALNGNGSLIKSGSAVLTMSGAGTYSGGTLLTRGDLVLASSGGAVTGPIGTGTLTLDSGVTAARVLLNGGQTVSNPLVMNSLAPGATSGGLQYAGTGLATWSGPITFNANPVNGGHLVGGTDAANALVLSGTFATGGTLTRVIQRLGFVIYAGSGGALAELGISGTARWGADQALPAGVQLFLSAGTLTGETGTVDLNGFNQTVAGVTFQNMAGGVVTTGAGTLTLGGDINATFAGTPDANVNTIAGNLSLGGASRTVTVANSTVANDLTISAVITNGSLSKAGAGTLMLSGTAANTHGTTTVTAGVLHLNKTAGIDAVPGALAISGGAVTFGANHQIADTATVTMSGSTSVFNGTAANVGALADYTETIAALTVTGGAFNCGATGSAPVLTVTGAAGFTGGAGNTAFIGQSGSTFVTGSLSITAMTNTAGGTVGAANTFTLYGASTTLLSTIRTSALTLNGARINLRRGGVGSLGSRLILDGDLTTITTASFISEDTNGGTTGALALELASAAGPVVRTLNLGAALDINVPITNGAAMPGGLTKTGTGQLNLGGATLANTYSGLTTVAAGRMHLTKSANTVAIPGDLTITGGQVSLAANNPSNQIADTSTVTMSGTTSVFNGTVGVNQGVASITETIGNLVVTGGNFNAGGTSIWTITGAFSMTGGGNTIFVGNSGHRLTVGSLSLTAMTATAGATVATNNSFTVYGGAAAQPSTLTVGAGGLTLDGSVLNLRRGNAAGQPGSKLVLNGNVTTTGTTASSIKEDTAGGTLGVIGIELSSSAGAFTRTLTTPAGADLTISIPIMDGAATPGALTKAGAGTVVLSAINTCTGAITVDGGSLRVTGSTTAASAVAVNAGAKLEGTGTVNGSVALNGGTIAPGTGGTTIGNLTIPGAITWSPTSAYVVDLNGAGSLTDFITTPTLPLVLDGNLSVGSLANGSVGQVFTILNASSISGTFAGIPDGTAIPAGGRAVRVNYIDGVTDSVNLTVTPPPTVTSITPASGPMTAQTPVDITGTLFMPGATVTIGGNPATSVVWVSDTLIRAVTPTGNQGLADVVVINPELQSGTLPAAYLYIGPVPTVTGVTPPNGPALTTNAVTISGTDFFAGAPLAVSVGGIPATAVTFIDRNTISATFPVMSAATTDTTPDVLVTIGDGQQATLTDGFTYDLRPVDDATGAIAGLAYRYHRVGGPLLPDFTTLVPPLYGVRANATINGGNPFEARNDNWSVEFGGYVTVPDDGVYTLYTASDDGSRLYIGTTLVVSNNFAQGVTERSGQIALRAGTHRLRAEFAQGNGGFGMFVRWQGPTTTKADIPNIAFTCDPAPTVTSISPTSGPQSGGTTVTISGSGFVAGSLVAIDGTVALSPVVLDENTITATTPGGTTGAKNVLVIGPRSTGAVLAGGFTYVTSAAPTLTAITPPSGTALGGTTVQLTVANVDVTPTVTFNGIAATSVVRLNATTVECVTPAMPLTDATADVTITAAGQSSTLTNGYTWTLRIPENPTGTQAGLSYGYYRVGGPLLPTFSAQPAFSTGVRATPGFTTNVFEARNDNWSVRYVAYLTVPSDGVYTLYTASDDGSRMYVGNTLVVENNFAQGVTERSGTIGLAAGTHLVAIEFAQGNGGFGLYVRWSGPGVAKADIPASAFTCDPVPVITSLDVINGPQSGGTVVTITGSGFTSGATVTFGGTAAIGVTMSGGGTTLTCTTPSHAVGLVDVTVVNLTGTNATLVGAFTYDPSSGPTISDITPPTGPADGGTAVTITGSNFSAPMTVTIGGQPATNVVISGGGTTITALTPQMQSATLLVDVVVTNGAAQSATLVGGFTYTLRVPENPSTTQAGLTYRYHRVGGPLLPTFASLTPFSIGVRATPMITPGTNPFEVRNDNWSVEYLGYVTVPADGVYTFFTESDDGSQLLIGSGVVVQNNFAQGMTERSGSIGLATGTHLMTIRFAQGTGGYGLNVRWQGPSIAKQLIPNNVLSTAATPVLGAVTPASGSASGGTTITLTGSGFTNGSTVSIGGTPATGVVVAGDGLSLTAVTPAHAAGTVAVTITNAFGLSTTLNNGFICQGPAPVITAVSPQVGPLAGGTTVLIYGSNFMANPTVRFGGVLATNVSLNNGVITARTPAGTQGPVDVTVTNTDGTSGTRSPGFYYQGAVPTITGINPARGAMAGGYMVIISGSNFTTAGVTVTFDGIAATDVTVSPMSGDITARVPAGAQGPANVVVTNYDMRTASVPNGFIFEGPAPTVTGIVATSGPTSGTNSGAMAGGTSVTITGTNFALGAVVDLDGVLATGVTVVNGTTITATTPAGTQGFADLTVTNVDFLTDTLPAAYIYLGPPPAISGIAPAAVPINYNDAPNPDITISGSGFVAGATVTVQGQAATVISVNQGSPDTIVFHLPISGLSPGPATIVVTNVDLQSTVFNGFILQGPAPILRRIDVPHGPVAGGRLMTLTGSAFRAGAIVTMGGVPATVVTLSATTITAMTPAHAEGAVDVVVTNDDLLPSNPLTYTYYEKEDHSTVGNGCGTGGGLAVFLLLGVWLVGGGSAGQRRR